MASEAASHRSSWVHSVCLSLRAPPAAGRASKVQAPTRSCYFRRSGGSSNGIGGKNAWNARVGGSGGGGRRVSAETTTRQQDAFVHACGCGQELVIERLLVEKGMQPDVADSDGNTGIMMAIQAGHISAALLLLEHRASIEQRNASGCTPLIWAAHWGRTEIVQSLLARECNRLARDEVGSTSLHHAAANGHQEVALVLLEAGLDAAALNREGKSPLQVAEDWGKANVAALLQDALTSRFHFMRHIVSDGALVLRPNAAGQLVRQTLPDTAVKRIMGFITDRFTLDGTWTGQAHRATSKAAQC